jgi:hypothetical protein
MQLQVHVALNQLLENSFFGIRATLGLGTVKMETINS